MKDPYGEGIASHTGPESCGGVREDAGEALTGEIPAGYSAAKSMTHFGVPTRRVGELAWTVAVGAVPRRGPAWSAALAAPPADIRDREVESDRADDRAPDEDAGPGHAPRYDGRAHASPRAGGRVELEHWGLDDVRAVTPRAAVSAPRSVARAHRLVRLRECFERLGGIEVVRRFPQRALLCDSAARVRTHEPRVNARGGGERPPPPAAARSTGRPPSRCRITV